MGNSNGKLERDRKMKIEFVRFVIFNLMKITELLKIDSIVTYKHLLLYIFSPVTNKFLNDPIANIIKSKGDYYEFCHIEYPYQLWDFASYVVPVGTDMEARNFQAKFSTNREYYTLESFYKILKYYKLKSLDEKIDKEIYCMLLTAIDEFLLNAKLPTEIQKLEEFKNLLNKNRICNVQE